MKIKYIATLLLLVLFTIGALQFIRKSNDHLECNETVERSKDADGNPVKTTTHHCKESFSL